MEQKKALRIGKLNIVDIVAIILVLLVAVYGAYRLLGQDDAPAATYPVTYVVLATFGDAFVVRAEDVPKELYENCAAHVPTTLMAKGALLDGQIVAVEATPYMVLGPDGQWAEDPDHVNLYLTCKANVPQESVVTTKIGEQEVRLGKRDYILKSEYIEFQGATVVEVNWGE